MPPMQYRSALGGFFPLLFWLFASPALYGGTAPSISSPPASQTIFYGDPAVFRVSADGTAPLAYQWFRNGAAISTATASQYTLANVSSNDSGASFFVQVTNAWGAATSSPAVLSVDFGIFGAAQTNRLLNYTNLWRYDQTENLDGINWTAADYDDSAWPSGPGLLAHEDNGAITPLIKTVLDAPASPPAGLSQGHAFYFRTRINVTNSMGAVPITATIRCDDGAVVYINGAEAHRVRIADGPVNNLTFTTGFPPDPTGGTDATTDEYFYDFAGQVLNPGTNVLAVEVHQANSGSSDIVWGMALDAVTYQRQRDTTAPTLTSVYPPDGTTVRQLTTIEVVFTKPVGGVDASDLLIDNHPCSGLTVVSPSQYIFTFTQPPSGAVQVAWASSSGIHDLTSNSNAFAATGWSLTLDPNAPVQSVVINEFMASNDGQQPNSLHDELGNSPDWIELYNPTSAAVDLTGWSLTDNPSKLAKWTFPSTLLTANSYLVVFASGRDTNVAGQLHTNFKLSSSPSYLALVDPGGSVVSSFSPAYPAQYTDISYGRDRLDLSVLGYFTNSTPGAPNATTGPGFGPGVHFSRASGTFQSNFSLVLSTDDTNSDIRYVLISTNLAYGTPAVTNIPTASSTLYTGPIVVNNTVQVRARSFPRAAGYWPGPPHTESYVRLSSSAAAFTSDLPILLMHNLAGGALSASVAAENQSMIVMVFEPVNGRASLTNPPVVAARGGFNIRGSSTAGNAQYNLALELWDEYNQDNKMEFCGMPAESDWVLYAQDAFDTSYLHNPLAHQLERDLGHYSSRTRFAEAFLNTTGGAINYSVPVGGDYFGLYTVEEKIKRDANRVDVSQLDPQDTNSTAITGGYILKIDRSDSNETTFYDSYAQNSIVFVYPQGIEMATAARRPQYNYITGYFSQFGAALWGTSYTNPTTGYAAYIDVDDWIDVHIINTLSYNVDAFRLSGYFYKDRGQKLCQGPSWDFDRSMGMSGYGDVRSFNPRLWYIQQNGDQGTDFFGNPSLEGVRWWQRLFTDPDFWQRWIDRWTDLRRSSLSTNHIFSVIDTFSSQLTKGQPRENSRWSGSDGIGPRSGTVSANGYSYAFPGTYAGETAFLKHWFADRVDFMDTNFLRAPVFSSNGGAITNGFSLTITAPTIESGTIIYYSLDGTDPRLPGGAIRPGALSHASPLTLTLTNNARVFARDFNITHHNLTGGAVGGNPPISSPWSGSTAATFIRSTPTLAITELMYHPVAPASGTNSAEDYEFLELKNVGSQSLNLVGVRFTNGIDFTFTSTNAITNLRPGQYAVLVANAAAFATRYPWVTNVAGQYSGHLDNSGEHLYLEGAMKEPILDFSYNNSWYPDTDGLGFSLVIRNEYSDPGAWGDPASWRPSAALGGSPGVADGAPPNIPAVVINEALTHTDPPEVDSVELYNPSSAPAAIGGWFLTDNSQKPWKYRIPEGTTIPAGGYLLIDEHAFNSGASNSFRFDSLGEEVYLFSADGTNLTGYRHGFAFGAQANGVTFGRHVSSDGREHFVSERANTLGAANAGPKVGPIVISEIMYAPAPFGLDADNVDEFVELRNVTGQAVPLFDPLHPTNTWELDGGIQFTFPQGATLPPWSFALVVPFDPAHDPVRLNWFISHYGVDTNAAIFGPFQGKLANEGDRVALYTPDKPQTVTDPNPGFVPYLLAEEINYASAPLWPTNANGTGYSLQRLASIAFGDDPANWQALAPSAGRLNPNAWTADTDHDGLPDEWELANGLDPNDPTGNNGAAGDPDGDGRSNLQEYLAGTDPHDSADYLRFDRVAITGNSCALTFTPRAGRVYSLESCDTLGATNIWTAVQSGITGTNSTTLLDPLVTARFYRLKVSPGP